MHPQNCMAKTSVDEMALLLAKRSIAVRSGSSRLEKQAWSFGPLGEHLRGYGEQIKNYWNSLDPSTRNTVALGGLGAGIGGLSQAFSADDQDKHRGSRMLTGALAGGALGVGTGLLASQLPALRKAIPGLSEPVKTPAPSEIKPKALAAPETAWFSRAGDPGNMIFGKDLDQAGKLLSGKQAPLPGEEGAKQIANATDQVNATNEIARGNDDLWHTYVANRYTGVAPLSTTGMGYWALGPGRPRPAGQVPDPSTETLGRRIVAREAKAPQGIVDISRKIYDEAAKNPERDIQALSKRIAAEAAKNPDQAIQAMGRRIATATARTPNEVIAQLGDDLIVAATKTHNHSMLALGRQLAEAASSDSPNDVVRGLAKQMARQVKSISPITGTPAEQVAQYRNLGANAQNLPKGSKVDAGAIPLMAAEGPNMRRSLTYPLRKYLPGGRDAKPYVNMGTLGGKLRTYAGLPLAYMGSSALENYILSFVSQMKAQDRAAAFDKMMQTAGK